MPFIQYCLGGMPKRYSIYVTGGMVTHSICVTGGMVTHSIKVRIWMIIYRERNSGVGEVDFIHLVGIYEQAGL
jgi:hypothetical protein